MLSDRLREALGDARDRVAPTRAFSGDERMQQAAFVCERLRERRALDAEPAEIGGVLFVARDLDGARRRDARRNAAAGAAIGTGRLDDPVLRRRRSMARAHGATAAAMSR